ncbi:hypothetical protein [Enterococcus rivorum]|uniref:hypothetical protein n=1 Tax=Enterococcus rivorum TaxID=762845 RepID=UPI0036458863
MIKKSKYYIYPIILLSILVALFLISGKSNTKIKAENVSNTNDSSYLNDSDSNNSSLISKEKFELLNNFSKEKLLMQDFAIGNESDEISLTDSVSGTKHSISWQSLSTKGTYVGAGFPSYKVNNQAILSDSPYFNSQLIINGEFIEQSSDKNNIFLNAENIVYGKKVNENKLVVSFLYKGYPISIYQTLNEDKSVTVDYSIQNSTQKEKTIGLSQISSFGKEVSVVAQDSLDSILLDYKKGNDFWIETKSFNNWALGELEMIKDSTINLYEPPTIEGNGWETGIQTPKNLPVKSEESTTFKNGGLGLKTAGKIVKPEESVSFQQVIHSLVNKTTLKLNVPLTKILEKDNKEALISGEIIGSNDESYSVTIKNITNGNERVIEQTKRAIYSRSTTPKVEFSTVIPKDELSYGDNILKISAINKNGDILEENVTINYLTATSKAIVSSSSTDTISLTDDLGNKNSIGWTSSGVFDEPNVIPNYMSNDQSWMNDYGRAFGAALIVDDNPAVQYDRPGINTTTIRNIFSRAKNVVYTKDIEKRKLIVDFLYEPNASHKYKITLSQELNDDGSTFLEYTVKNNNAVTKKIGMQQSVAIKTESLKPGGSPEARVIPTNRFRGILLNYKLSKENNTFAISPIGFDNWAAGGLADVSGKNNELSIYSEVHITGKGWESGIQTPKKEKLIVGQEVLFAKQIAALTMKSIGETLLPVQRKALVR